MIARFKDKKCTRKGVYCSLTEATMIKPSRDLGIDSNNVAPNYIWKSSSNDDYHAHSPVLTINSLNVPILASKESEMRNKGKIRDYKCSDRVHSFKYIYDLNNSLHFTEDEDEKDMQRQMLLQSILNDRENFIPTKRGANHHALVEEHHNLITSTHIIVNKERANRNSMPLCRENGLDELASEQAKRMATGKGKKHSDLNNLISKISDYTATPIRKLGENVCGGNSIDEIFQKMMGDPNYIAERNNMLDRRFSSFGIGIATSSKGKTYICQIFKG